MRYVPGTAYQEFNSLSDKAIAYASKLNLQHRFLVIQEAAGLADGNGRTLLRQLLSEDQVRRFVVQSTNNGNEGQELPIVEGPIGLLMTTTANALHPEDETRLLTLHVDQSPEQIMRALSVYDRGGPTKPPEQALIPWHALYDFVCSGNLEVVIPYAAVLRENLPTEMRVMRDFPKLLALIRAHALLHQCNRRRDSIGRVIADTFDYHMVHSMAYEAIAHGLQASVPLHIKEVVDAVASFNSKPVSVTELAQRLGKHPGVISKNVKVAIRDGYLEDRNPGQGRTSVLVIGERKLPEQKILPDPKELFEKFGEPQVEPLREKASAAPPGNPERHAVV